jgi:phage gpG-like protein
MSLVITPDKKQALSLKNQLLLLSLPANKRTRILKALGRHEKKLAMVRIRKQKDITGKSFKPRKGNGKGKLLKRLGKTLKPYVKDSANRLELTNEKRSVARVAAFHSEGGAFTMNKKMVDRRFGKLNKDQSCSRGMAKALSKKGFKVRKNKGKGYRRATIKELMSTLTMTQAGAILKRLRNRADKPSWQTKAPPRPFLGDTPANVQAEIVTLLNQLRG